MEKLVSVINDSLEKIIEGINESDLIIIVKNNKVNIIEHGKALKGVQKIEFSSALDEIPTIKIEKVVF